MPSEIELFGRLAAEIEKEAKEGNTIPAGEELGNAESVGAAAEPDERQTTEPEPVPTKAEPVKTEPDPAKTEPENNTLTE